jgi:hypothetical protein
LDWTEVLYRWVLDPAHGFSRFILSGRFQAWATALALVAENHRACVKTTDAGAARAARLGELNSHVIELRYVAEIF